MQWREECIILSLKAFSESSRIVTVFNKSPGKTSGLVNGMKASIQPGDVSDVCWRGRSAERLGTLTSAQKSQGGYFMDKRSTTAATFVTGAEALCCSTALKKQMTDYFLVSNKAIQARCTSVLR
ncbi:hypothetical protein FACS189449_00560 [Alphaproteobacteria bacterium]|nr:hypothetical protein FACS189449_00560 [Alphaproteobacteria bacterium]